MDLFQWLGILSLLTVMSRNQASYAIMASPLSYRISPGAPSGSIDLIPPVAAIRLLITFMSKVEEFTLVS